jgi:flavin reductase (DIM6/NTAB) family NADH-FMN oxidoreductase RutF
MHLTRRDISEMDRIMRLNVINSVPGIKPANLIGTISKTGNTNLAIFSSVVHLGSNPALLGFILRPGGERLRHTYRNIKETGFYTINQVHRSFVKNAHYTSAKFEEGESEFETCRLQAEYLEDFPAPFVGESPVKTGMFLKDEIPISINETRMIIGQVEHIFLPDEIIEDEGHLDLSGAGAVGISGLNSYYSLEPLQRFPYARPEELPDFM